MNIRHALGLMALCLSIFSSTPVYAQKAPMIPIQEETLEGKAAPALDMEKLGGGRFTLDDYKGKVLLVGFWASWCGPCQREMPEFEKLYKEMAGKGLMVVGVNVDRDSADAVKWLKGMTVSFPIGLDPDARLLGAYQVQTMPTSFVIDRKGIIRKKIVGFRPEYIEEIEKMVNEL